MRSIKIGDIVEAKSEFVPKGGRGEHDGGAGYPHLKVKGPLKVIRITNQEKEAGPVLWFKEISSLGVYEYAVTLKSKIYEIY